MRAHEWRNVHAEDCVVTRERQSLLSDHGQMTVRDEAVWRGCVAEYDNGGDQEVELCTCGFFLLVGAFNRWDSVVREYVDPMEDGPPDVQDVVARTQDLVQLLMDVREGPRSAAWAIMEEVTIHTGSALWGYFSDSTSDAPCDIEWDLHMLQAVLHPGYQVPEEVWPAYVIGTVFDGPQVCSDGTPIDW